MTTLCCFLLCFSLSYSQNFDSRLFSRFSESELIEIQKNDPKKLAMMTYALDHAIFFSKSANSKLLELEVIQRPLPNKTYIDLDLTIRDENQYFKIEGEEQLLVVKSKWVLTHEMKNQDNDEK